MFTPTIRIVLVIFSLSMAFYFFTRGEYILIIMPLIAAILFIYGYFKYGTVYAAFMQLKKGNFDKAEKLLLKVNKPKNLDSENRGYYHFSKGLIYSNKKDWDNASKELNEALNFKLRTENDTSIVILNLAEIELNKKEFVKANQFLERLKSFKLKPLVKQEADIIESKINAVQQRI